jgi:hypothetical protein
MRMDASRHSTLETSFLGARIPAGTDGRQALKIALDRLFAHANVGPFFARQMIQRLVTGNPSPAYVARVAAAFNDNGSAQRGDLKAVWRAILLDPEARDPATAARSGYGKVREPMARLVQWGHTFGDAPARSRWYFHGWVGDAGVLGQSPMRSPSVFNWFRPGYVPPSTEMAVQDLTAPEFQIVDETSVAAYINFIDGIVRWGINVWLSDDVYDGDGTYHDPPNVSIPAPYANEMPLAGSPLTLVKRLNLLLTAGRLSADTELLIANAVTSLVADNDEHRRLRVAAAVHLVMSSPEYLIQK